MLNKLLAGAMVATALGGAVTPAVAADVSVCYEVYVDIDGTVTEQANCVP